MANYQSRNERKINRGFKRLNETKDIVIERGMRDLLEYGMAYALNAHDHTHWLHTSTADSYGWALLHDGKAIAHRVNDGRHGDGRALADLMAVSLEVPQVGWVGILLASMEAETDRGSNVYFAVQYEEHVLHVTRNDVRQNFNKFFKRINA